jgi:solute carrier family 25 phosphate transporter 23/24/25/41
MNYEYSENLNKSEIVNNRNSVAKKLQDLGFSEEFIKDNIDRFSSKSIFTKTDSILPKENLSEQDYINLLKNSSLFKNYDDRILKQAINECFIRTDYQISADDLSKMDNFLNKNDKLDKVLIWDYQEDNTYLYDNIEETTKPVKEEHTQGHLKHFIAAGLACMISRTLTAPLERLKILYQVNYAGNGNRPPNISEGLKQVYKNDGFKGLFRGNSISLIKSTPDSAIKFYFFEKTKYFLRKHNNEELGQSKLFIAGAVGGVIANICIFPLDVIKTRMSAAPKGTYNGIIDTALKLHNEAGLRAFYKGLQASICCTLPNAGLNLSFYELLKRVFSGSSANDNANCLSTPTIMLIGGMSAMISSTTLYPLQTIQSRLIMQGLGNKYLTNTGISLQTKKTSMGELIKTIYNNEGYKGFFKGYCPGISKIVLGNALGFSLYENIKRLI